MPDMPNVDTDLENPSNRVTHRLDINLEEWCFIKNSLLKARDEIANYVSEPIHSPFWDEQLEIAQSAITQFDLT